MIVDDEQANLRLLERALSGEYDTRTADSGEACLEQLADFQPDVFLLDIMMPGGMDGFELCQKIRSRFEYKDALIIFLSALSNLREKTQGYRAGADDYITKPIELPVLTAKMSSQMERIRLSKQSTSEAMAMAMTALANGSEVGQINLFFEKLHDAGDYDDLGKLIIEICQTLGVNSAAQIRLSDRHLNFSTTGMVNTLEDELMIIAKDAARIYSFGNRCLFNFKDTTLLVRQMPKEEDKAGRYRDHLASVMNGVESRMRSLHAELALKSQNEKLILQALKQTHGILDEIMQEFKHQDQCTRQSIERLVSEMHLAFSHLDMEEDQENLLMNIITQTSNELSQISTDGMKLDRKFEQVILNLEQVLSPGMSIK
jgi:CheY-like chemotaxis protein